MTRSTEIEVTVKLANERELIDKIRALGASLSLAESRLERLLRGADELERRIAKSETDPPPRVRKRR